MPLLLACLAVLSSVSEVIAELGGRCAVQARFDASQQRVFNWIARGTFPPSTFQPITAALDAKGHTVLPTLWKTVPVSAVMGHAEQARPAA